MRRFKALSLFVLGYLVIAAFGGVLAAAPALAAFAAAGWVLIAPVLDY